MIFFPGVVTPRYQEGRPTMFGRPYMARSPRGPLFATMNRRAAARFFSHRPTAVPCPAGTCAAAEGTLAKPARTPLTAAQLALVSKRTD